ncbi:ABC transporter permease [Humibacter ginsenosidimutans]|uniref:ABC transporter permease n=1 Tax=Humibacter ginsenosidimutans TaxID=2599293 RepID=A0A5B8LZN5_9MICO|nr:ABC transporter permease [Humibacter ginsenosidimutans]QDZ13978.1 ABC transporter permease [Humibacter ginsenosidimutans]
MSWLIDNFGQVWSLTVDHVVYSAIPIILGFVIAVPIGWLTNRYRLSRATVLTIVGLLYTVPSLPLIIVLPTLLGTRILDPVNIVVALTIYAVAIMVRTASDAFASVDVDVLLSATAVGFSTWRRFWGVELPLAGPVLLSGVRVVSVSTISLLTVGAVMGIPNLGYLFLDGLQRNFPLEIVVGIVGTILIAVIFDAVLALLGRLLLPWTRGRKQRRRATVTDPELEVVGAS